MNTHDDPTVFVVEDDTETRESFCALASSIGVPVEAFASAEDFLAHVDPRRSGCAVVDFRLPGMNGLELQRRLATARHDFPVILVSAYIDVRVATEALQEGVFRILTKPYPEDELTDALHSALDKERVHGRTRRYRLDVEHRLSMLDSRERRTLELILEGQPNKSIGRRLSLSRRTVERIRSRILDKMNAATFVELAGELGMSGIPQHSEGPVALAGDRLEGVAGSTPQDSITSVKAGERKWRLLCCDLHDGPAQYVSAATMRLRSLQQYADVPGHARETIEEVVRILAKTEEELRDLVVGRESSRVHQAGLISSIRNLIDHLSSDDPLQVELIENLGDERLGKEQETAIFRIIQEALNNTLQHSQSRRVHIEINRQGQEIHLRVQDWGQGFKSSSDIHSHLGLRGIRQRVRLLNGALSIETAPGQGTSLAVRLPAQEESDY